MLLKCCTQYVSKFGKLGSGHRTGKALFSFQSQRKAIPKNVQVQFSSVAQSCLTLCNPVDCNPPSSSVHGILQARVLEWVAISFSSKVMLKILQARLQQYVNRECPDVQAGFRKGRGTRDKLPTSAGSWKMREFSRKTSISALLTMPKPLTVWITINWKILKEMGIPDHLTCLLRNLYAGQEATIRIGHGTIVWFQTGKGIHQGCILSPCLFKLFAEYIMRNAGWRKHKLESRLLGEISITSDMQMTPPLWQKAKN